MRPRRTVEQANAEADRLLERYAHPYSPPDLKKADRQELVDALRAGENIHASRIARTHCACMDSSTPEPSDGQ